LVVILALSIFAIFFIRKRKQRQRQRLSLQGAAVIEEDKPSWDDRPKSELPDSEVRPMSELEGREGFARPITYELPGSLAIPD
jgi:hypothetical protein